MDRTDLPFTPTVLEARAESRANQVRSDTLYACGLPTMVVHALMAHARRSNDDRYLNRESLLAMSDAELMAARNLGKRGVQSIRERLPHPVSAVCSCCGGTGIVLIGEDA